MEETKADAAWEQIRFEDIELGEIIGGGGVGIIYTGWIKGKNETVALKTLFDARVSEDLRQEYLDELLVLSRVRHSNIVTFLGACMTPPHLFFVMELCSCSLFDKLHKQREDISPYDCVRLLIDIGSAMEYLHAQKPAIIHRDLKSLNVLQAYDGSFKVCDFGLVKNRNTQAGTPAYMAPELLDMRPYNKSVDVYAFAILFWEVFTKEIPFFMNDPCDIRTKVTSGTRPHIPAGMIPPQCLNLIKEAWNQESRDRPDFTEIVDRLIAMQESMNSLAPQYTQSLSSQVDTLDSMLRHK